MNEAVVKYLICPHCGIELRENGGSLVCSNGHTANIARQGYVSLLGKYAGTHTADSAEMVAARERVLGAGLFDPIIEAIREEIAAPGRVDEVEGAIVDLGTGTGHYLAAALDAAPDRVGIGVDNSKYAARKAAKSHERAGAVVADIWDEIPVRTESAAIVINVFAPRNGREIERILATGGRLIVITPNPDHLKELIEPFEMIGVDPDKEERLEKSLGEMADEIRDRSVEWTMEPTPDQVRDLVGMGPSAGRIEPERLEELIAALDDRTTVTGSVRVSTV
ncbi:MAG TPA: methyltransferase domain-containing protein [Solirubrobacterales bacterium]|nr:methyltransferase domain-containing protein [Solirubrobacterales bacterium]